jgi:hypothetical protein
MDLEGAPPLWTSHSSFSSGSSAPGKRMTAWSLEKTPTTVGQQDRQTETSGFTNLPQSRLRRRSQSTLLLCAPSGNHDVAAGTRVIQQHGLDRPPGSFDAPTVVRAGDCIHRGARHRPGLRFGDNPPPRFAAINAGVHDRLVRND